MVNKGVAFYACLPAMPEGDPGIGFDYSDGVFMRVCKVEEDGAVALYNSKVAREERVQEGDYVLEVNGMKGRASLMMLAFRSGGVGARMLVVRPLAFVVQGLDRSGGSLGLDLVCPPRSRSLEVTRVLDAGAVAKRNTSASSSAQQVRPRDRIVSVNGNGGSSEDLLRALQTAQTLTLEFSRPAETL